MAMNDFNMPEFNIPEYISCSEITNVKNIKVNNINKKLSVLHINIRSLQNREHFKNLTTLLQMFDFKIDIVVISETWVNDAQDYTFLNIPDYTCEYYIRNNKRGGGIAVYVLNSCSFKRVNNIFFTEAESVFIEMRQGNSKVLIGAIYRPPSTSVNNFVNELDDILCDIQNKKTKCILVGDININILDESSSMTYKNVLESSGFLPYIKDIPTRISDSSSTLIDHIYSNINNVFCTSGVIDADISDHKPVFCVLDDLKVHRCSNLMSERYNFCQKT